ncbi:hypothetical protein OESDEN_12005 [Oesophagostomum dentatum]|uniref:Uncharacterized protein n=1 Tax=Oesophagostomum dentatum TaxID=61180 RepID=A0A0B1STD9_OESDE|nr:hypothetical protein OESDEN_12005 [Oesophagostomum dentatum]
MRIYSSGVLRVRFDRSSNGNPIPYEETTAKKLLLSQTHTNTHMSTQSNRSACGKLRSSDLQLSRTLLIVTSPQMKKQLKPTAIRLLECYCFKTVPEFGHRSTSLQAFN